MTIWEKSQERERLYDDTRWGIQHSKKYWMNFLRLRDIRYPAIEIGCGNHGIWRFDENIVGLDPIDYRYLGKNFVLGKAEDMSYPDKSFEDVLVVNSLDHTEDPEESMREIKRICRGRIVLWTYVFPSAIYRPMYRGHPHTLTRRRVKNMLSDLSLTFVEEFDAKNVFYERANNVGRIMLIAMSLSGVRAMLIHAEQKST